MNIPIILHPNNIHILFQLKKPMIVIQAHAKSQSAIVALAMVLNQEFYSPMTHVKVSVKILCVDFFYEWLSKF